LYTIFSKNIKKTLLYPKDASGKAELRILPGKLHFSTDNVAYKLQK